MGRRCSVCGHQRRAQIDQLLVAGLEYRDIADIFGVTRQALCRHKASHIPEVLLRTHAGRDLASPVQLAEQLRERQEQISKLLAACDRYLEDPEDPKRYRLYVRAADIWVNYTVQRRDGSVSERKGRFTDLASRLEERGVSILAWRIHGVDPADLLIRGSRELRGYTELLAKIAGLISNVEIQILQHPEWTQLETLLVEVLQKYPGALEEYDRRVKEVFGGKAERQDS